MSQGTIVLLVIWGVCGLVGIFRDSGALVFAALASLFWGIARMHQ